MKAGAPHRDRYERLEKELEEWHTCLGRGSAGGQEIRRRLSQALRTRCMSDYEAAGKALHHWLDHGTLLDQTRSSKPQTKSEERRTPDIRVHKARDHSSHASKEGRIRKLMRDGVH